MTSIKLTVTGAQIWASVTGVLTSGMVGIPITIEYDEAWDGLTKNLMCRCSPWGSDDGEIRTRLNVGEASTVAHEVMQQGMYLYLGVEGFRADGTLVIPTTWARCGKIEYGANTCDDPSMDPELTIWNQLQTEMEETKKYVLTPEQAVNIQAYAQEARQAAEEAKQAAKHGLYYIPTISQPTDRTLRFAFTPSITGAPTPKPVTVVLPDDEDSGQNATLYIGSDGPTGENRPLYWLDTSGDAPVVPNVPEEPEAVTLVGIAASYTGGDVAVGTALDALTGITVTASYSDGSSKTVTGYSLSGEIVEGSNTITVTYQGKTATFTVTGVAQGGGELPGISSFVLDVPYLTSMRGLGNDISNNNNPAVVAAGNAAANLPITDYLNSGYAELYAISYRPNAGDVYGGPIGWRAYRYGALGGIPVWQEETQIANISINSTSGVDSSKLKIHKLVRADILAALSDGYSESDIRAISQYVPNLGSKNHNVSVVWMATAPTEEQQRAIIAYFEGGGN